MLFEGDKVILCHGVVDLRKGPAGLLALVPRPKTGVWYMFGNRRRTLIKCVRRDERGLWAATRRLDRGHFYWIEKVAGSSAITVAQASDLCDGRCIKRTYEEASGL